MQSAPGISVIQVQVKVSRALKYIFWDVNIWTGCTVEASVMKTNSSYV